MTTAEERAIEAALTEWWDSGEEFVPSNVSKRVMRHLDAAQPADAPQARSDAQGDGESVPGDSQDTHEPSPAVAELCGAQADEREAPTLEDLREELAVVTAERDEATAAVPALRWPAYDWTGPGYAMQGTCGNCTRTALVYVERGHELPGYHNGPECPHCGCHQWVGWRAPEEASPEKDVIAGLRSLAQIPHVPIDGDDAPSAGGREAALEAALRQAIDVLEDLMATATDIPAELYAGEGRNEDYYRRTVLGCIGRAARPLPPLRAALALTPTDAAKAAGWLADRARCAVGAHQRGDMHALASFMADLDTALRPFGGAGDA